MPRGGTPVTWHPNRKVAHMTNIASGWVGEWPAGRPWRLWKRREKPPPWRRRRASTAFDFPRSWHRFNAALANIGRDVPGLAEVGTSVVLIYGRHPVAFAQLVRTAQNATGGRLTLGIGTGNQGYVEGKSAQLCQTLHLCARVHHIGNHRTEHQLIRRDHWFQLCGTRHRSDPHASIAGSARPLDAAVCREPSTGRDTRSMRPADHRQLYTAASSKAPKARNARRAARPGWLEYASPMKSPPPALAREISAHYQAIPSYAEATKHEDLEDPPTFI